MSTSLTMENGNGKEREKVIVSAPGFEPTKVCPICQAEKPISDFIFLYVGTSGDKAIEELNDCFDCWQELG